MAKVYQTKKCQFSAQPGTTVGPSCGLPAIAFVHQAQLPLVLVAFNPETERFVNVVRGRLYICPKHDKLIKELQSLQEQRKFQEPYGG